MSNTINFGIDLGTSNSLSPSSTRARSLSSESSSFRRRCVHRGLSQRPHARGRAGARGHLQRDSRSVVSRFKRKMGTSELQIKTLGASRTPVELSACVLLRGSRPSCTPARKWSRRGHHDSRFLRHLASNAMRGRAAGRLQERRASARTIAANWRMPTRAQRRPTQQPVAGLRPGRRNVRRGAGAHRRSELTVMDHRATTTSAVHGLRRPDGGAAGRAGAEQARPASTSY